MIARKKEQLNLRLDPDLKDLLARYCEFSESSQSYVIERLLRYGIATDSEFQAWLEQGRSTPKPKQDKTKKADSTSSSYM